MNATYETPEARELTRKRAALQNFEAQLLERELERATVQGQLNAFQRLYYARVGAILVDIDRLEAQLAAIRAKQNPHDPRLESAAHAARRRAEASTQAIAAATRQHAPRTFAPSDPLKRLYRDVAKLVHPDLTSDASDRSRRTAAMAAANRAYESGDEAALRAILDDWVSSPEQVVGDGVGAELVRVIRQIERVERRLAVLEKELAALRASELWTLKGLVDSAAADGRDLLAEMVAELVARRRALEQQLVGT